MKNKTKLLGLLIASCLSACVQLPNLLPNGNGQNSDMVIVELNEALGNTETIIVNDSLVLDFDDGYIVGYCLEFKMSVNGGNILTTLANNKKVVELSEGDLVGGFVEGAWKNNAILFAGIQFFPSCINSANVSTNKDVVVGIRFKSSTNKMHYGWAIFYADTTGQSLALTLKTVGYNKLPGVNVRIGD